MPGERRCVIRERVNSSFAAVDAVNEDIMMGNGAGKLEVRVGHRTGGVGAAHDVVTDCWRERCAPEDRM